MGKQIQHTFAEVFNSPAGKEVMKHLEKSFKEKTDLIPDTEYKYYAGQRSVLKFILNLKQKGEKE
jgi:hypothetical protein